MAKTPIPSAKEREQQEANEKHNAEHRKIKRIMGIESLIKTTMKTDKFQLVAGNEWDYNFDTNKLSYIDEDLTKMTDRQVIGEVYHIIGQAKFTDYAAMKKIIATGVLPNPIMECARLLNVIQTNRTEEQMMETYPGTYDYLWYKFKKYDNDISFNVEEKLPCHLQYLHCLTRQFWNEKLCQVKPIVKDALMYTEEAVDECLFTEDITDMINILTTKIRPTYEKLLEESKEEEQPDPNSALGKAIAQASGQESMQHIIKAMQDDSKKEKGNGNQAKEEKQDFQASADEALDKKEEEMNAKYGDEDAMKGEVGAGYTEPSLTKVERESYEAMYTEIKPYLPFFKKKLMSIMEDNRYNRMGGSYRSGKLASKKLWKISAGSDKLFSRKIIRRHKDYKVTLLVDESGSMTGDEKNRHAAKATVLLAEVLTLAGIDFEIRGFNTEDRLYKPYGVKYNWKHRRQVERIILESHGRGAGGNNDGRAVRKAHWHQKKVSDRGTERIIIALSDGQPAPGGSVPMHGDNVKIAGGKTSYYDFDLKYEIAEASKDTTLIGIGINARHVSEYYPNNVIVDNVSQLPTQVLSKLKAGIRRG